MNLVPDPLFLRNGVRIPVENDSDCLMMMREGDIDDTGFLNVFINFEVLVPPPNEDIDELDHIFLTPHISEVKHKKKKKGTFVYDINDLSEEELDPIPPMVEDEDALIKEEYDVLNPNNINIDEITPEEGYRSDESESEGSEGYEPHHEEFEKLTHEIIDEGDGKLPPVQIEIEEPYVGMEWSTIQKCGTYLRTYAIANRFEFRGKKNDGDRVRLNCKRE
ncbi:hypothetical protein IFM89_003328 [Coptis chinensis]|uniref:Transposase MuDR plant domain-containing protein n=1 Tax=Coptis chinensis TaxID=261450 RepID=A0A835IUR9_9MAGN|nr:hypothetical protein IFM89_003328 [Coptis chinensis]